MAFRKRHVTPRQKMINLMYVVLMAMLALNVSPEVLNGYSLVGESLKRTASNATKENRLAYLAFDRQMKINPEKTSYHYGRAQEIRHASDSLFNLAEQLKNAIAIEADGSNANPDSVKNKDDVEATAHIMLIPGEGMATKLADAMKAYRQKVAGLITNPVKRQTINNIFNPQKICFESLPAISAITYLTKLQTDVRYAEGEVLHSLMANIDEHDLRVNSLDAFVIPSSQTIIRGNKYEANIVMAAVDTTCIPSVYIDGKKINLDHNKYVASCNKTGDFTLKGWLELPDADGAPIRKPFSHTYSVVEPTATISADMMNVLYAGYDNPISISVPGVPLTAIKANIRGGNIRQTSPGRYIVRPTKVGEEVNISVYSDYSGTTQKMAEHSFRVRKLPEPTPYISIKDADGVPDHFRGGGVTKHKILASNGISAAVDDGLLYIPFKVLSFEIVFFDTMGNAIPILSDGAAFSQEQRENIKKLSKGKRFYITHITAIGPDRVKRQLNASMEVKIK